MKLLWTFGICMKIRMHFCCLCLLERWSHSHSSSTIVSTFPDVSSSIPFLTTYSCFLNLRCVSFGQHTVATYFFILCNNPFCRGCLQHWPWIYLLRWLDLPSCHLAVCFLLVSCLSCSSLTILFHEFFSMHHTYSYVEFYLIIFLIVFLGKNVHFNLLQLTSFDN